MMNLFHKKTIKRKAAMLLAALMLTTSTMPGTTFDSLAAPGSPTELQPDTTMKKNSGGQTTAYVWGPSGVGPSSSKPGNGLFDIEGIEDARLIGKDGAYTGDGDESVNTTYARNGYNTVVRRYWDNTMPDSEPESKNVRIGNNGGVQTFAELGLEVQMKVYPSKDQKWILVDYILYNKTAANNKIQIATDTDVRVGGAHVGAVDAADNSALKAGDRGFHMVNEDTQQTFDLVYNDANLEMGLTEPSSKWVGHHGARTVNRFTNDENQWAISGEDSGLTYSWTIDLQPYEMATRRIAFAAKGPSYYVAADGTEGAVGAYDSPLATIQEAMQKIGDNVGYIYIQGNYNLADTTTVSPGANITFMSSDYNRDGDPISDIITLQRADNNTGSMFSTSGGTMRFSNLILQGNAAANQPIISADSGTIGIMKGAVLQDNTVTTEGIGSAINVTGSANLEMNFGTIQNNVTNNRGAVNFEGGTFTVQNEITIIKNTATGGKKANVYLAEGKHMTVAGNLDSSKIGVTTAKLPDASAGGGIVTNTQEVTVAVPKTGSPVDIAPSPFIGNFSADAAEVEGTGLYMTSGSASLSKDKHTVLKKNGYQISFYKMDADSSQSIGTPKASFDAGAGDPIDIERAEDITGYELTAITIEQGDDESLTSNMDLNPTVEKYSKITGTMPGQDVTVTYLYKKVASDIIFVANGKVLDHLTLSGTDGDPMNATLPTTTRHGYKFLGWTASEPSTWPPSGLPVIITTLPSAYPPESITYYAVFKPDGDVKFDYTVEHTNQNGSIEFQKVTSASSDGGHSVEAVLEENAETIHGYRWSQDDSTTVPEQYIYNSTSEAVGSFDSSGIYDFIGTMPGQDTTVRFRYAVDYGNLDARSALTVNHKTEGGTIVSPAQTDMHYPEDEITTQPVDKYGYECVRVIVDAGSRPENPLPLLTFLEGTPTATGVFTSKMPNQDVEITYIYGTAAGGGFPLTVRYQDATTQDDNLKDIIDPMVHTHQVEDLVGSNCTQNAVSYQLPYGYQQSAASAKSIVPDDSSVDWIESSNDFGGRMPAQDVTVTYNHTRMGSEWADVTYQTGKDADNQVRGQLTDGDTVSPDVDEPSDGIFTASVLRSDGTDEGQKYGYTLGEVREKHLMPVTVPNQYYRFAGWFIDMDGNKQLDSGETLLKDDYQFTESVTLTAHFEEDPEQWLDVFFKAGANGSIVGGPVVTKHTTTDKTWSDIDGSLPPYTWDVNYLEKGWYEGETPVVPTKKLVDGQTYTIQFRPDPDVFGTEAGAPDAVPGIDNKGDGRITVYNTTVGYHYVLTDLDGKVLEVIRGNAITDRVVYEGLYPGTRYHVYEIAGNTELEPGDQIGTVTDQISAPTEVLIPVVDTNYQVYYDEENEGKTVLIIKPADRDSDYALLDSQGNVVETKETGAGGWQTPSGSPASVSFSGLDYNKEYTVVARPKGQTNITAQSKRMDGTVIATDPGGELELPTYIVETVGGVIQQVGNTTVNDTRYEEAHKGDQVTLTAEAANDGQPFSHWEFLIGSVKGFGNESAQRTLSFTMPDTNLVLTAVYKRPVASPANAVVEDEVRGGSQGEMALDPTEIPGLEAALTTSKDQELIAVNKADVTYKVVYRKNYVKTVEAEAVKVSDDYNNDHEAAFKEAWGLDVSLERYVNGRKVATPTNAEFDAAEFNTYVQLEKDDVDMMDYQLYEITEAPDGTVQADKVTLNEDPEETGGLYTFTAKTGARYVMVYSRAYRLYFLNNTAPNESRYRYHFKVRREESPDESYYAGAESYGGVADQLAYFVSPDGAEYNYKGWSYQENDLREFDPSRKITRKTYVYANYENNVKVVDDTRNELENAIDDAIKLSDDNFLKSHESQEMKDAIQDIQNEVLDKTNPKATIDELKAALDQLKDFLKPYEEKLEDRYDHYDDLQHQGNSGGSGGGGGGGRGTKQEPFNPKSPKSYEVGTNGNWVEKTGVNGERQLSFVLNGGKALSSMWARLDYPDGEDQSDGWYHFNSKGVMDTGWFCDEQGGWYYCNRENEGSLGKMAMGWHKDNGDGNWYHLNPETGAMSVGWRQVGGKWYYFETQGAGVYVYDPLKEIWTFGGGSGRPLGSMYKNETTPDGYQVDEDGAWIQ